jgi:hypothetical protein
MLVEYFWTNGLGTYILEANSFRPRNDSFLELDSLGINISREKILWKPKVIEKSSSKQ